MDTTSWDLMKISTNPYLLSKDATTFADGWIWSHFSRISALPLNKVGRGNEDKPFNNFESAQSS